VTVIDKSTRRDGTFSREDFYYDPERDVYLCPGGKWPAPGLDDTRLS
jgi:hypothetical protein